MCQRDVGFECCCVQNEAVEHEVTCFAGIEDMGDTPVMSAL